MYKTVKKGDTSLQYTILPQTDATSLNAPQELQRNPVTKYSVFIMLILITSVSAAVGISTLKIKIFSFPKKIIETSVTNINNELNATNASKEMYQDENKHNVKPTVMLIVETLTRKNDQINSSTSTTPVILEEVTLSEVVTEPSSTLRNILRISSPVPKQIPTSSETPLTSETSFSSSTHLPSTLTVKKTKMPRITLKLRENETVPQMYMKSVIASNEKGNITTSVLAHGLSLEGLIFKTPGGTIRPWSDPTVHSNRITEVIISLHSVLAMFGLGALLSLWFLFYVQRKMMKRQNKLAEEAEADKLDGDKSTLLKVEVDDNEENGI